MENERKGYIWRNPDGDYYYVWSIGDTTTYSKIYEVDGDEFHFRDQDGKDVAVHFNGSI